MINRPLEKLANLFYFVNSIVPAQPAHTSLPPGTTTPQLRQIGKTWAKAHKDLSAPAFETFVTSLIHDPFPIASAKPTIN
jgi:hypothetical protein